jgi:hypothetical protein
MIDQKLYFWMYKEVRHIIINHGVMKFTLLNETHEK